MVIDARHIPCYLSRITFPVTLKATSGDSARLIEQSELLELLTNDQIVGVGSWKRIKYFRLRAKAEEKPERYPMFDPSGFEVLRVLHAHEANRLVESGNARWVNYGDRGGRAIKLSGVPAGRMPASMSRVIEEIVGIRYKMVLCDTRGRQPAYVVL